ncbi:MAG: hypothetical protein QNJ55_24070 [Xenococcus sp. MO_188.B8]|nr:hypothetical protein [Xenococcus sp. MO_188.B8]
MYYRPRSKGNLRNYQNRLVARKPQKIGTLLRKADLISPFQIELALRAKQEYSHLRLGEIIAMQGWLKPETADFFVEEWSDLLQQRSREPLGYYLQQAALLEKEDVEAILEEQILTGVRFGTVAVLQGLIKSTTLDFFLMHLFPEQLGDSPFVNMHTSRKVRPKYSRAGSEIISPSHNHANSRWQTDKIDVIEPSKIFWID